MADDPSSASRIRKTHADECMFLTRWTDSSLFEYPGDPGNEKKAYTLYKNSAVTHRESGYVLQAVFTDLAVIPHALQHHPDTRARLPNFRGDPCRRHATVFAKQIEDLPSFCIQQLHSIVAKEAPTERVTTQTKTERPLFCFATNDVQGRFAFGLSDQMPKCVNRGGNASSAGDGFYAPIRRSLADVMNEHFCSGIEFPPFVVLCEELLCFR